MARKPPEQTVDYNGNMVSPAWQGTETHAQVPITLGTDLRLQSLFKVLFYAHSICSKKLLIFFDVTCDFYSLHLCRNVSTVELRQAICANIVKLFTFAPR